MTTIFMSAPFDFGTSSNSKLTQEGDCCEDQDHSTVDHPCLSFLGFDVRDLDEDDAILRGLHVALEENTFELLEGSQDPISMPVTVAAVPTSTTAPGSSSSSTCSDDKPQGIRKRRRRKRTRRPCTVLGCPNRVVQGGVCVAHGARRKLCKFQGCDKCVKKAGFCSTHGPARKRCEVPGCSRVAVQGGICIGHGAKKVPCFMEGCRRQALSDGLCRIHSHSDDSQAGSSAPSVSSTTVQLPTPALPAIMDHFHEIPSLLPPPSDTTAAPSFPHPCSVNFMVHPHGYEIPNAAVAVAVAEAPAPSQAFQRTMYSRGLSIFEEMGLPAAGSPMPPPPLLVPPNTFAMARSIPTLQEIFNDDDDDEWDAKKYESV